MLERTVQFGTSALLSGVLTEPLPGHERAGAPAVVLINSGILHKVGSCRLYVRLARALADAGFVCLRFDLSGLGDSEVRRDALSFEQSSVLETKDAMDYLQRIKGSTSFLLAGLCSGADVAHMTSLEDTRVSGMASIDARTHMTPMFWWHHYAPKALKWSAWRNWVGTRLARLRHVATDNAGLPPDEASFELPTYIREVPPREELARDLRHIVGRGIRTLYIFTDGLEFYNHQGQHRSAFSDVPFGSLMQECHLRGSDHIVTDPALQRRVIDLHVSWATELANTLSKLPSRTPIDPPMPVHASAA